jgi:hypothetical protein
VRIAQPLAGLAIAPGAQQVNERPEQACVALGLVLEPCGPIEQDAAAAADLNARQSAFRGEQRRRHARHPGADHGNVEQMWDPASNGPHTAHTLNLVEVFAVGEGLIAGQTKMRVGGRLADIAPTVLHLMGLAKPAEMTGQSLILG